MAEKSIIIIGAGIGGLAAGCYGQMNGYDTRIFEMHDKPGGLCTAWQRKDYTIDGCLHWLVGSAPDSNLHPLWQEVGALQGKQIINMDQFCRIETSEGKVITVYCDIDRLEKDLKEMAPEDTAFIEKFAKTIRRFAYLDMPVDKAPELFGLLDILRMIFRMRPLLGELRKWNEMTMKDFAMNFKNPQLREAWQMIYPLDFSVILILFTLAWTTKKDAGYVIGGSMEISRSMEKRYLDLGGEINYKSKVEKILVENNRAIGIRLQDGKEYKADYVISAADGHATIFEMLGGKYINDKIRRYYEKMSIFQPLVYVALGVNRSFEEMPKTISGFAFPLEKPIQIGNKEHKGLGVHIYNFDPTFAPPGKTVLTVIFESEFMYWNSLRKDMARYKAEKEKIADAVVEELDKRFTGLSAQVEMRDVATPVTFHRYTGNWQGSYEGWMLTPQNITLRMKKSLPGLRNFYMVGQWIQPGGGLPSGLTTGCHVIQILCKRDKKRFTAKAY